MKRIFLVTAIVSLTLIGTLFPGAIIAEFRATSASNAVELKWIVTNEVNVRGYELYRSLDDLPFEMVKFLDSQYNVAGEKIYTYIDDKVFKPTGGTYHYKLKIVENSGSVIEYDEQVTINPNISSARHTWGSIKAMFR